MIDFTPENLQPLFDEVATLLAAYGLNIIAALVTLVVGWIVSQWLSGQTLKLLRRIPSFDEMLALFLSSLVRYGILIFTVLAVLNKFGVQTASIIAVLGAASLAIGLAMQGTLKHIAAGVMLLVFRPFKLGDFIEAGGISGTVTNIGLFMTDFKTLEGLHIVVPNSELWDKPIKNYSHNPIRRIDITLGIAYDDDIGTALQMARDIITNDSRSLTEPEPFIAVGDLGESSVNILVRVWCQTSDFFVFKCDLMRALKEGCDKNGLSIPFPQRTVHMTAPDQPAPKAKPAAKTKKAS